MTLADYAISKEQIDILKYTETKPVYSLYEISISGWTEHYGTRMYAWETSEERALCYSERKLKGTKFQGRPLAAKLLFRGDSEGFVSTPDDEGFVP